MHVCVCKCVCVCACVLTILSVLVCTRVPPSYSHLHAEACLLPEPPKNGYIVGMPDVVGEGTAIFFGCNTGYKLSQGGYVVCKANGFWEGDSPICVRDGKWCSSSGCGFVFLIEVP